MCRHIAYLGPPVTLERLLLQPPHSLMQQAFEQDKVFTLLRDRSAITDLPEADRIVVFNSLESISAIVNRVPGPGGGLGTRRGVVMTPVGPTPETFIVVPPTSIATTAGPSPRLGSASRAAVCCWWSVIVGVPLRG